MTTSAVLAAAELPADVVSDINKLLGWVSGIVGVICLARLIFVGGRIAWDHKHNPGLESPVGAEALASIIGWIIASGAALTIAFMLVDAGQAPQSTQPGGSEKSLVDQIQSKTNQPPAEEEK